MRCAECVCVPVVIVQTLREFIVALALPVRIVGFVPVTVPRATAYGKLVAAFDVVEGPNGLLRRIAVVVVKPLLAFDLIRALVIHDRTLSETGERKEKTEEKGYKNAHVKFLSLMVIVFFCIEY